MHRSIVDIARAFAMALVLTLVGVAPFLASAAARQPVAPCEDRTTAPIDRLAEPWWAKRHAAILARLAQRPDPAVVLIGDSITHNYDKATLPDENFQPTWQRFYAPRHALNQGFSGDTTANVLWRLRNGELDGIAPKAAIVLIGTNDTARDVDPAQVGCGIDAIVGEIERRLPTTHVLLLGILPSAISPEKSLADATVNAGLADRYARDPRLTYLDVDAAFRSSDGRLDETIFYDPRLPGRHARALHPDTVGQARMAEAIEPTLARLLRSAPAVPLAAMTAVNTAVVPVPRLEQDSYDWYARHDQVLALKRTTRPRVVMIGDSITHFWAGTPVSARRNGPAAWDRLFGRTPVLNLGFGWDRTQNVLWRLRQGEFRGLTPREVVLNIGTNNLTATTNARANTPWEIVDGIAAIVAEVRRESPASRITVMAIFPRGLRATDPLRQPIAATNRLLAARFVADPMVRVLDIGAAFLDARGTQRDGLFVDGTHPGHAGYAIWAAALAHAGIARRPPSIRSHADDPRFPS